MKAFLATIVAALAAPAAAFSAGPTLTVRDVPLHAGARTLAATVPRFNMVAVHWRGTGVVELRTRSSSGAWSAWQAADDDVSPDVSSSENRIRAWRLGSPVWTGRR